MNLKEKLLNLNIFYDNEYLDKYVDLIELNNDTKKQVHKTQSHHIIPRCYYKYFNLEVNNNKDNLVNLSCKDHLLAHCYLTLSIKEDKLSFDNALAVMNIYGHKNMTKEDIENLTRTNLDVFQKSYEILKEKLSIYNPMYNKETRKHHLESIQSKEVRDKISKTMKLKAKNGELFTEEHKDKISKAIKLKIKNNELFSEEHKKHLSESAKNRKPHLKENVSKSGYVGGCTGLKMMYDLEGKRRYVNPKLIEEKLNEGWTLPQNKKKQKITDSTSQKHNYIRHKNQEEVINILSKSHEGQIPWNKGIPCRDFTKEKLSNYFKGTRWMNNGIIQKQVQEKDIEEYLSRGFNFGRIKKGGDNNE